MVCRLQKLEEMQKWHFNVKIHVSSVFSFAYEHGFSAVKYTHVSSYNYPLLAGKYESILANETGLGEWSM